LHEPIAPIIELNRKHFKHIACASMAPNPTLDVLEGSAIPCGFFATIITSGGFVNKMQTKLFFYSNAGRNSICA
jgi:hypothetical protein